VHAVRRVRPSDASSRKSLSRWNGSSADRYAHFSAVFSHQPRQNIYMYNCLSALESIMFHQHIPVLLILVLRRSSTGGSVQGALTRPPMYHHKQRSIRRQHGNQVMHITIGSSTSISISDVSMTAVRNHDCCTRLGKNGISSHDGVLLYCQSRR